VNTLQAVGGLPERQCNTRTLPIFGYEPHSDWEDPMHYYGTESKKISALNSKKATTSLSRKFFITENQIIWAVQEEMAVTLEDILARRTRCLFLNAFETEKIAPQVASIVAEKFGHDASWIKKELKNFNTLVKKYQL
jgi:glycerol-3-phosphate dehydrogenase